MEFFWCVGRIRCRPRKFEKKKRFEIFLITNRLFNLLTFSLMHARHPLIELFILSLFTFCFPFHLDSPPPQPTPSVSSLTDIALDDPKPLFILSWTEEETSLTHHLKTCILIYDFSLSIDCFQSWIFKLIFWDLIGKRKEWNTTKLL